MVNVQQLIFALPWLQVPPETQYYNEPAQSILGQGFETTKSVAIVGAGSAGLSAIKTFIDVADKSGQSWEIVAFEQRRDVGGVWLPDPQEPHPPELPETPLYPMLRTNTPHPSMIYPGFSFRPMTNLYPLHDAVWQYHSDFVSHFNLSSHIHINFTVTKSSWIGNATTGFWNITYTDNLDEVRYRYFDHLIVASGHNYYPYIPTWPGQEAWIANTQPGSPQREILHSVFWRGPEGYENRTVLVIGTGASGRDAIRHTALVARKMYLSLKGEYDDPSGLPPHELRPPISHFTSNRIYFEDGSYCADVDAIILGTGYELRVPFLEEGKALHTIPSANSNATYPIGLVTNLRYIFPLYEHILSLAPQYPPTALSFIGLPSAIANFPSDKAQSLFAAYAIANPSILPSREDMLRELNDREERLRLIGKDPYYVGHRLVNDSMTARGSYGHDYQDSLFRFLRERGAIPKDSGNFVEGWRRRLTKNSERVWDNWVKIEEGGEEKMREWLEGVETEEQWASLLDELGELEGDV